MTIATLRLKDPVLAILLLITFIGVLPLDVILPSFPALAQHYSQPLENISLSLSLFVAGFLVAQLLIGPLSDRLGRKNLLLGGLALAAIGAIGVVFTNDFHAFVLLRSLQAMGCGCFVLVNALIQDLYPAAQRHSIRIVTTTAGGLFICIAPLIGIALQAIGDWPASFIFFAAITVMVITASALWLPKPATARDTRQHLKTPINPSVLIKAVFLKGSVLSAIGFSCHFGFMVLSPVIFLVELSLPGNHFALVLLGYGLAYLAGGAVASAMRKYAAPASQIVFGLSLIITAGAALGFTAFVAPGSIAGVLAPMILCACGITILRPAATSAAMDAAGGQAGTAAAVHNAIIFAMGAITSALVTLAPFPPALSLSVALLLLALVGVAIVQWPRQPPSE